DAAFGLIELLDSERKNWSGEVLAVAADRFEVRLTTELARFDGRLTTELGRLETRLATELARFDTRLTSELSALRKDVSQELVTTRVDMLRWSFVFWIGQVAAVTGLLAYLLRR